MSKKTIVSNYNSSEKYETEISMLNSIISKAEAKNPKEGTAIFFNLQEMKRRRENIFLALSE